MRTNNIPKIKTTLSTFTQQAPNGYQQAIQKWKDDSKLKNEAPHRVFPCNNTEEHSPEITTRLSTIEVTPQSNQVAHHKHKQQKVKENNDVPKLRTIEEVKTQQPPRGHHQAIHKWDNKLRMGRKPNWNMFVYNHIAQLPVTPKPIVTTRYHKALFYT